VRGALQRNFGQEALKEKARDALFKAFSSTKADEEKELAEVCLKARSALQVSLESSRCEQPEAEEASAAVTRAAAAVVRKGAARAAAADAEETNLRPRPQPLMPAAAVSSSECMHSPTAPALSPVSPSRQMSATRSKRRVIGGIVRSPSATALEPVAAFMSRPKTSPVAAAQMFLMDDDDAPSMSARESSLTRGYDALGGAEIFNMDSLDRCQTAPSPHRVTKLAPPTPPAGRSRMASASHPSASAMMMDLGLPSPSSRTPSSALSRSASFGSLGASIVMPKMEKKSSSAFLPAIKSSKAGLRQSFSTPTLGQPLSAAGPAAGWSNRARFSAANF